MYSLAAKVIEEKDSKTIVVELRDRTTLTATKDPKTKVGVNEFVSIIRGCDEYEVCGQSFHMDCVW